jgi:hypothetical protein
MRRITFFGSALSTGENQIKKVNTNKTPRANPFPIFMENPL